MKMNDKYFEQGINMMKFLFDLENIQPKSLKYWSKYGEKVMSRTCVFEWCLWLSERKDELEFESRSGHWTT
jgi:hypothetical protein